MSDERESARDALNRRIDVHTCRQHHTAIRFLLDEFPTREPFDPERMRTLLTRLSQLLATHLRLEDEHVYPALGNSQDEAVQMTARAFRDEMGGLMMSFLAFRNAWSADHAIARDSAGFLVAWSAIRSALETRMDAEDRALYPQADAYLSDTMRRGSTEAG